MMATGEVQAVLGSRPVLLLGKAMLCLPFVLSGLAKLADFPGAVAEQQHFGLPMPTLFAALVIATQLGGSILMFTRGDWVGALWLAAFTVVATVIAHAYWTFPEAAQFEQRNIFFEHAAIVGGFIIVAWLRWSGRLEAEASRG